MQSIGVRMAKASDRDIEAALELSNLMDAIGRGYYPASPGDDDAPLNFDSDDIEHLRHLHARIKAIADAGSLFRVVGGLAVLLNPQNAIVDPDADHIALHPRLVHQSGGAAS